MLTDKAKLEPGYRVTKVKSTKVAGKKYEEIQRILLTASNDIRIDYAVIFEEGDLSTDTVEEHTNLLHLRPKSGRWSNRKSMKQRRSLRPSKSPVRAIKANHQKSHSFSGSPTLTSSKTDDPPFFPTFELAALSTAQSEPPTGLLTEPPNVQKARGYGSAAETEDDITSLIDAHGPPVQLEVVEEQKGFIITKGIEVNVLCVECKNVFVIDDSERKYHCLDEKNDDVEEVVEEQKKSMNLKKPLQMVQASETTLTPDVISENAPVEAMRPLDAVGTDTDTIDSPHTPTPSLTALDKGQCEKYNGLCPKCLELECTVDVRKLDAVLLAPCSSGHVCYISSPSYFY